MLKIVSRQLAGFVTSCHKDFHLLLLRVISYQIAQPYMAGSSSDIKYVAASIKYSARLGSRR